TLADTAYLADVCPPPHGGRTAAEHRTRVLYRTKVLFDWGRRNSRLCARSTWRDRALGLAGDSGNRRKGDQDPCRPSRGNHTRGRISRAAGRVDVGWAARIGGPMDQSSGEPTEPHVRSLSIAGRTVCVVDDDFSLRRALRRLITAAGFSVDT